MRQTWVRRGGEIMQRELFREAIIFVVDAVEQRVQFLLENSLVKPENRRDLRYPLQKRLHQLVQKTVVLEILSALIEPLRYKI